MQYQEEPTAEEFQRLGKALWHNRVQCGHCSEAVMLLEAYPDWDYGFYVCEQCAYKNAQVPHPQGLIKI